MSQALPACCSRIFSHELRSPAGKSRAPRTRLPNDMQTMKTWRATPLWRRCRVWCSPAFSYSCNLPISRKASCSPSASRSLAKRNRKPNAQLPHLLWKRWRSQSFDLIQLIDLFFSTCLASDIVFLPARTITTGCITRLTKRALPEVSAWITWSLAYNKSTLPLHTGCQIYLAKSRRR